MPAYGGGLLSYHGVALLSFYQGILPQAPQNLPAPLVLLTPSAFTRVTVSPRLRKGPSAATTCSLLHTPCSLLPTHQGDIVSGKKTPIKTISQLHATCYAQNTIRNITADQTERPTNTSRQAVLTNRQLVLHSGPFVIRRPSFVQIDFPSISPIMTMRAMHTAASSSISRVPTSRPHHSPALPQGRVTRAPAGR
jgi:hypothetical protein